MKKVITTSILLFSVLFYGQELTTTKKPSKLNELKLNLGFTIAGAPEIVYERILSGETSCGLSLQFAADKDFNQRFSATPYFRYFFGKKENATGFFVEGDLMYSTYKSENNYYTYGYDNNGNYYNYYVNTKDNYSNVGVGFAVGAKWVTKKGFLFEIYGGPIRNITNAELNNNYDTTFTGRGGITAGYRF